MIPEAALQAAQAHAIAEYPRESCGLVLASGEYVACRNIAEHASEHFILSPEDYADAEDRGDIMAVVHSHPDQPAMASHADRLGCEASGLPWGIVVLGMDGVVGTVWIQPEGWEAPLIGREYTAGILDCWTLMRDWYAREMGIELPDFPRSDRFWDRGENLLVERIAPAGFVPASGAIQRGDLILMTIGRSPVANHLGLYLGDGTFLHHPYLKLSRRDQYGGAWVEKTTATVRYAGDPQHEGSP